MDSKQFNDIFDEDSIIKEAEKRLGEKPCIVVCGKTGAGKSSLINALLGREVNRVGHSEPTTQEEQEEAWLLGENSLRILDVPGFAEAGKHEQRVEFILNHLATSHIGLLVVGAPDRAWEEERKFIQYVHDADPDFPLLLVGNRIDMFNPVREWDPKRLNLEAPSTQKEKSIVEWASALQRATGMEGSRILLTSAGESFTDLEGRYGLEKLARAVVESLPAAVQNAAARALRVDMEKRKLAEKLIWQRSVAAAAIAATPIPIVDFLPLAAIQVELIVRIGALYGKVMDTKTAISLLMPVAATVAGRFAVSALLDFFVVVAGPAASAISAGIAGPATWAIGMTYLEFFASNNFKPSAAEIREQLKKKFSLAREQKDKMEEEARSQQSIEGGKQ